MCFLMKVYNYKLLTKLDQKQREQVTSEYERKVVKKFALETEKWMHSQCRSDTPNKTQYHH